MIAVEWLFLTLKVDILDQIKGLASFFEATDNLTEAYMSFTEILSRLTEAVNEVTEAFSI